MPPRLAIALAAAVAFASASPLSLVVSPTGSFTLTAPSWPNLVLTSAPCGVQWGGVWLSPADGSLRLAGSPTPWSPGSDAWGTFTSSAFAWERSSDGAAAMVTTFRVYDTTPAVGFTTTFSSDIPTNATAKDLEGLVSAFPSFALPSTSPLAAVAWYGSFVNEGTNGPLFPTWTVGEKSFPSAISGGPLVLFDDTGAASLVLSSSSNFMAASTAKQGTALSMGVLGSVSVIPSGFELDTVAFLGSGITANIMAWGAALLAKHGKPHGLSTSDFTNTVRGRDCFARRCCDSHLATAGPPLLSTLDIILITARTTTTRQASTMT